MKSLGFKILLIAGLSIINSREAILKIGWRALTRQLTYLGLNGLASSDQGPVQWQQQGRQR
jgi:hypothetical protein